MNNISERKGCIIDCRIGAATKLTVVNKVEKVNLVADFVSNELFKQLAHAFKKSNGSIGMGKRI
jgi:hypothetical protein